MFPLCQERESYKYKLWRVVESTPFEYFIMTLIVLNTILLMLKVRKSMNALIVDAENSTPKFVTICVRMCVQMSFKLIIQQLNII